VKSVVLLAASQGPSSEGPFALVRNRYDHRTVPWGIRGSDVPEQVEIGGEILRPGDEVLVCGGPFGKPQRRARVAGIGTRRIILNEGGTETAYSLETRSTGGNYRNRRTFRTLTEQAGIDEREDLKRQLFDLGFMETSIGRLNVYSTCTLHQIVEILKENAA
jgi:hypothetical protein